MEPLENVVQTPHIHLVDKDSKLAVWGYGGQISEEGISELGLDIELKVNHAELVHLFYLKNLWP